jgi:hypothetical protein
MGDSRVATDHIARHFEGVLQSRCGLEAESTDCTHIATNNDDLADMLKSM